MELERDLKLIRHGAWKGGPRSQQEVQLKLYNMLHGRGEVEFIADCNVGWLLYL